MSATQDALQIRSDEHLESLAHTLGIPTEDQDANAIRAAVEAWERDANLQDDWSEQASGRQLQSVKAHYVLASEALDAEAEPDTARIYQRLTAKLSRALAAHPDNVHGECEVYGTVKAASWLKSGKVASVFEGEELDTGRKVTIRLLKPEFSGNTLLVQAFVAGSEQQHHTLVHPQIARVVTPATLPESHRDKCFLVTAWTGTQRLSEHMDNLEPAARWRLAVELCQGLLFAHNAGCPHGDFSPDNVLLDEHGNARIEGFFAPPEDTDPRAWTQIAMMLGSPYYIAPEISAGGLPTPAADIFALGRTLFRLLTGKEENLYDVMVPQLFKQALTEHLEDYPELIDILERSTHLEPQERPASVREILFELQAYGGQLGTTDDPALDEPRANRDWPRLIEALTRAVGYAEGDELLRRLTDRAEIEEHILEQPRAALESWARIFETLPHARRATAESCLDRLASHIDAHEAQPIIANTLSRVLDADTDTLEPREQLRLHLKAARSYMNVDDPEPAIRHFRAALDLEPTHAEAFAQLETLYERLQDWPGFVALLTDRAAVAPHDDARIDLLLRRADIQDRSMAEFDAAVASYREALELVTDHPEGLARLEALLRRLERWDDVVALLTGRSERIDTPEDTWPLLFSIAQAHQNHRFDEPAALELYARILAQASDHPESIEALEGLMQHDSLEVAVDAAKQLEPIYRRREDAPLLADALEVLARVEDTAEERWEALLRAIASLRETHDAHAAFDAYARLHQARREDAALRDELRRVAPLAEPPRWGDLVALFLETIHAEPERDALRATLWREVGALRRQHLHNPDAAIAAYVEVLAIEPDDDTALTQLEELYTAGEQWPELVGILETRVRLHTHNNSPDAARNALHRIADLHENAIGNAGHAIEAWARAIPLEGDDSTEIAALERLAQTPERLPQVATHLDPLYVERASWEALDALLRKRLEHDPAVAAPEARASLLDRIATLAEEHRDLPEVALDDRIAAVDSHIDNTELRDALARITDTTQSWSRVAAFYDQRLDSDPALETPLRVALLTTVGHWYWKRLDALDTAVARFEAVLELEPEDRDALDALDALFSELGQSHKLHAILGRKALLANDSGDEITLRFRMARIADDELGDLDLAIEAYDRIIDLDSSQREALIGLASVHERREDFPAMVYALERRVDVEDEATTRIELLTQIGALATDTLQEDDRALGAYADALALQPESPRHILLAVLAIHHKRGHADPYFDHLPRCLEHARGDAERVRLQLQAAHFAREHERDTTPHYQAILALEPYHPEALDVLEATWHERQDWTALQDIFRRQFASLHLRSARVAKDGLHDLAKAREHLLEARALDAAHLPILDLLIEVYQNLGDEGPIDALQEQRIDLLDDQPEEKARLLNERAAQLVDDNPGKALDARTRALLLVPRNPEALAAFVPLALSQQRWEDLTPQVLGALRQAMTDAESAPLLATLEYVHRATTAFLEERPDDALDTLRGVMEVSRIDLQLLLDLYETVFQHFGALDALIAHMRAQVDTDNPRWRNALLTKSAELAEGEGQPEQALEIFTQLFQQDPGLERARTHMLRIAVDLGRQQEALDAIAARIDAGLEDPRVRIDLSLMLAHHNDNPDASQEDLERAITYYQIASEADPTLLPPLEALARLHQRLTHHDALADVLRRIIDVSSGSYRAGVQMRLAHHQLDAFDEPAEAITLAVDVLDAGLDLEDPVRRDAAALLEAQEAARAETGGDLYHELAPALRNEYAARRELDAELALLERMLALVPEDATSERIDILQDMTLTARQSDANAKAFELALRWFDLEPENATLQHDLLTLADDNDALDTLVTLYAERMHADTLAVELRVDLALALGEWQVTRLDQPEDAVTTYRHVLSLDDRHPEAIEELEMLYDRLDRPQDMLELLLRKADISDDLFDSQDLRLRAADIAEAHDDAERAFQIYTALVTHDPTLLRARESLLRLADTLERQAEATLTLAARVDAGIDDPTLAIELALLVARRLDDEEAPLERRAGAVAYYEKALDLEPELTDALDAVIALHRALDNSDALIEALERKIQVVLDPDRQAATRMQLAHHLLTREDRDEARAIHLCEEVLTAPIPLEQGPRPDAITMLEALELEIEDPDLHERVFNRLREEYADRMQLDAELALLERKLARLDEDDLRTRIEVLDDMVRTAIGSGDKERAFAFQLKQVQLEPQNEALRSELESNALELRALPRLITIYQELMHQEGLAHNLRVELAQAVAEWQRLNLELDEDAAATYRFLLDLEPDNREHLEILEILYAQLGQKRPTLDLLRRKARLAEDDGERRSLLMRAADIAELELQDPAEAALCYEQLLDALGPNTDDLAKLEQLHEATGNLEGRQTVLRFQLELAESNDPERVPDILMRLAHLSHRELEDIPSAITYYERLRELRPQHVEILRALRELYERTEAWASMLDVVVTHSQLAQPADERFELTLTAADLSERIGAIDDAITYYQTAYHFHPLDPRVMEPLYRLLEAAERWSDVLLYLRQEVEHTREDPQAQIESSMKVARLAIEPDKCRDFEVAAGYLRYVIELDPNHQEALFALYQIYKEDEANHQYLPDLITKLLEVTEDTDERVQLLIEQGDLYWELFEHVESAMHAYQSAYELSGGSDASRDKLVNLYMAAEAWDYVMHIYEQDIARCEDTSEAIRLELKLASLIQEKADNPQYLIQVLERAYARKPDFPENLQVILSLIEAYADAGALTQAANWIEKGFAIAEEHKDRELQAALWYQKGLAAFSAGNLDAALISHQECFKLDNKNLPNILALSDILYQLQNFSEGLKVLQVALLKKNELSDMQCLQMYYLMGMIRSQLGEERRAKDMFRRALQINPEHPGSLKMLEMLG